MSASGAPRWTPPSLAAVEEGGGGASERSRGGRVGRPVTGAVFSAFALLAAASVTPVAADVSLRWQAGSAASTPMLAEYLVDSNVVSDFIELVSENFRFETPLVVAIGAGGGPDYEAPTNTIRLPYDYLERAVRAQATLLAAESDGDGEEALAVRRALDVIEYTLYHLLGHALAGSDGIEVEELAEALSSWVVLGHWPGGAAEWRRVSVSFAQASQRLDGPLSDYWHAHGLHAARERLLACWIIGRDTGEVPLSSLPNAEARQEECRARWIALDADARERLDGVLHEDAPLRLER